MTKNNNQPCNECSTKPHPADLNPDQKSQTDINKAEPLDSDISSDSIEYQEIYKKLFGSLPRSDADESSGSDQSNDQPDQENNSTLTIFDYSLVKELADRSSVGRDERKFYGSLSPEHATKPLVEPTRETFERFQQLFIDYPNAHDLLSYIQDFLHLRSISTNKAIYFPPVLISGPAGIGKTCVVQAICRALNVDYGFYDFSSASSSWGLCGQDSGWNGSHIGLVLKKLLYGTCANPVIHIDEACKGLVNQNLDPYLALHTLLERPQMRQYHDAFAQNLPINASYVTFIATANNIHAISRVILSRFRIIELSPPTPQQMRHIVLNMYRRKLEEEGVQQVFRPDLSKPVIDYLANKTPREAGLILARGIAAASAQKPSSDQLHELQIDHLSGCQAQEFQECKMGFVWP
ncbi:AAA family ATPase [Methylomonas sp. MgM2]